MMVGVGITILVRRRTGIQVEDQPARIFYYKVYEDQSGVEKLAFLARKFSSAKIEWQELQADEKYTWLTDGLHLEFTTFLPIGTKEAKATSNIATETIFRMYGGGVKTNRDTWTYDLDRIVLVTKVKRFLETYNNEVERWRRRGSSNVTIDDFVTYDDSKIKWSSSLKLDVQRGHYGEFTETKVRQALYRPFCKQWLFFDRTLVERVYQQLQCFPTTATEAENSVISLTALGSEKPFMVLISNMIPDMHLVGAGSGTQCFPFYTYTEDGTNRRENITDWVLSQFQAKYGPEVNKWDIFHYVYAMLHHPQYRERYAENLN